MKSKIAATFRSEMTNSASVGPKKRKERPLGTKVVGHLAELVSRQFHEYDREVSLA